jgi:hypothetical protein
LDIQADELTRQYREALGLAVGEAVLNDEILALDVPRSCNPWRNASTRGANEKEEPGTITPT